MIKIQKIASICAASLIGLNIGCHTIKAEIPDGIIKNAKKYKSESSDSQLAIRRTVCILLNNQECQERIFRFMEVYQLISNMPTKEELLSPLEVFTSSNTKFLTIHYRENHQLKDIIQIARTTTGEIKLKSLFEPLNEEMLELWFNDYFHREGYFESLNSKTKIDIGESLFYAKLMP